MNLRACLAATLICFGPCLALDAGAMTIHDFGKMDDDDEATFVTLLVEKSADYLKVQGHPDQARQLILFFKTPGKEGGTFRLADQIKEAYEANTLRALNPNNRVPDRLVEDAMATTLRAQGFNVPASYLLGVGQGFRADGPPRTTIVAPSVNHP